MPHSAVFCAEKSRTYQFRLGVSFHSELKWNQRWFKKFVMLCFIIMTIQNHFLIRTFAMEVIALLDSNKPFLITDYCTWPRVTKQDVCLNFHHVRKVYLQIRPATA
jgi:hypothetical protein